MRQPLSLNGSLWKPSSTGLPLVIDGRYDSFNRSDRAIDAPWTDANTIYPTMFDPTNIVSNRAAFLPLVDNDISGAPKVGHHLIVQDIGVSDEFEVGLTWVMDDHERWIGQVGPAALVDLNSADPLQMGVSPIYDISIFNGTYYIQNVFREAPISNVFNSAYYTTWNATGNFGRRLSNGVGNNGLNWLAIRCTGGTMQKLYNGEPLGSPVAIPAWAANNTWAGIHVISAKVKIGDTGIGGGTITQIIPELADNWYWRPL